MLSGAGATLWQHAAGSLHAQAGWRVITQAVLQSSGVSSLPTSVQLGSV